MIETLTKYLVVNDIQFKMSYHGTFMIKSCKETFMDGIFMVTISYITNVTDFFERLGVPTPVNKDEIFADQRFIREFKNFNPKIFSEFKELYPEEFI